MRHFRPPSTSNEGAGPAEDVRTFCILKTQGRPWRPTEPAYLQSQLATIDRPIVVRRLTSHGEPIRIDPGHTSTRCAHESGAAVAEEIYVIVGYSTPWGEKKYEDWDLALETGSATIWKQVDAKPAAAIYHDAVVAWSERLSADDVK